jgi:hypothetical protein
MRVASADSAAPDSSNNRKSASTTSQPPPRQCIDHAFQCCLDPVDVVTESGNGQRRTLLVQDDLW